MNDEVTHMRIVDGSAALSPSMRRKRWRSSIYMPTNIELVEVLECDAADVGQLAAKDEMQQLAVRACAPT